MKRRLSLYVLFTLAFVLIGNAYPQTAQAPAKMPALVVAVYPGALLSLPEYVGLAQGTYLKHGVNVSIIPIPTGPDQIAAMASGSVDISGNTAGNLLLANAQGQDFVIIANNFDVPLYTWMKQPEFPTPNIGKPYPEPVKDFKGARLGISARGSEVELFSRVLLQDAGLNPDRDVNWVAVGFGQTALAAFQAKQVDVLVSIEPVQTILLSAGTAQPLLDLRSGKEGPELFQRFPGQARVARRAIADGKRDAITKYIAAQVEILEFIRNPANLDTVAAAFSKGGGMAIDLARKMIVNNRHAFNATFDCAGYSNVIRYLERSGQFSKASVAKAQTCEKIFWAGTPNLLKK